MIGLTTSPRAVNRGMILAVGRYGARVLAELWPRLRFEDDQRIHLRPDLPSLRRLLSVGLILPGKSGGFVAGSLRSLQTSEGKSEWDKDSLIRKVVECTSRHWDTTDDLNNAERSALIGGLDSESIVNGPGTGGAIGREAFFRTARDTAFLSDHILQLSKQALVDEDAPGSQLGQFAVYVVASLADRFATPMLWPLVMTVRQQLEGHLPLEVVGLFSTGAYAGTKELRDRRACVHVALQELTHFSQTDPDLDTFDLMPIRHQRWREQRYFDHCFLLDSQKHTGTLTRDEDEVVVATGNILEVLLLSEGLEVMEEQVGPDQEALHRQAPFSSAGTASLYIPLDEWRRRNRTRFVLETLQREILSPAEGEDVAEAEAIAEIAGRLITIYMDVDRLTRQMIHRCPFSLARVAHRRQRERSVEHLLSRPGQDSPDQPVPEVVVNPEATRVRFGRHDGRDAIPPDDWLRHLYLHYRRLGLDRSRIFPNDPEADEFEEGWPADIDPRTYLQEWFEVMLSDCDSRNASVLAGAEEVAGPGLPPAPPAGIVPDFRDHLREAVAVLLRRNNRGLLAAGTLLEGLSSHMRHIVNQTRDYRLRLDLALRSIDELDVQEAGAARRLHFRRLLNGRPHAAGLFARMLMLAALLTMTTFYGLYNFSLPGYLPQHPLLDYVRLHAVQLWPPVSVGLALAAVTGLGLGFAGVHRFRLGRAIRAIERDLARQLNLSVNRQIVRLLFEDNMGVLVELNLSLVAQTTAVNRAIQGLQQRVQDLQQDLSQPLSVRQPFIREVLPGLEKLRRQLVETSRPPPQDIPSNLLLWDAGADRWLDDMLAHDTEAALLEAEDLRAAADDVQAHDTEAALLEAEARRAAAEYVRARYQEATENYGSLDDLVYSVIERLAEGVGDIVPPRNLKITTLIQEQIEGFTPRPFLADLSRRAQIMLNWDPEDVPRHMPVPVDMVSTEEATQFIPFQSAAAEQKLRVVSSADPFAITIVRFRHGFPVSAVPHFRACQEAFRGLGEGDRVELVLARTALGEGGDYLNLTEKAEEE